MDTQSVYDSITEDVKNGAIDSVLPKVESILAEHPHDTMEHIKCASLLKSIDLESECQGILDRVVSDLPEDPAERQAVAVALRNLGRSEEAFDIVRSLPEPDPYELAMCMHSVGEDESALSVIQERGLSDRDSRILLCECLCSVGEHASALREAEALYSDIGGEYDVLVNLATAMVRGGDAKGAAKFLKDLMKHDKKDLDVMAAFARIMLLTGKMPAAVNYSVRVVNADGTHLGALETLAMCHVEKGSYGHAKIIAGRINELDPGNPASVRIIDACRIMGS